MSEYLQFERIEQYLDGTLEAQEKADFEQELAQSTALQLQLATHRAERALLNQLYTEQMRTKMQAWEQELYPTGGPAKKWPWRPIMLLGSLALTGILFLWWWSAQNTSTPVPSEKPTQGVLSDTSPGIAQKNTPPPDTPIVTPPPVPAPPSKPISYRLLAARYDQPPTTNLKGSASSGADSVKVLIRDKQYKAAISLLESKETLKSNEKTVLAYAYFKNEQYAKATELYEALDAAGKNPYAQQAQWYLCLVMLEQMPSTQKELNEALQRIIQQKDHGYRSQALELKKELRFK